MLKVGEKRSSVWDSFYQIPVKEDEERYKKRVRMVREMTKECIGVNPQLVLPLEIWLLVRDFYQILLQKEYVSLGKCRMPHDCNTQFYRVWEEHRQHNIFCRDDYKLWYYHFYKEKVDNKNNKCDQFIMKPLTGKKHPTLKVMKHINYGRVLYMLNKLS